MNEATRKDQYALAWDEILNDNSIPISSKADALSKRLDKPINHILSVLEGTKGDDSSVDRAADF